MNSKEIKAWRPPTSKGDESTGFDLVCGQLQLVQECAYHLAVANERGTAAAPTFWVVERFEDGNGKSLGYWTGHNSRDFTPNLLDAIQFVRREDALLAKSPWHWQDCEATEHKWLRPSPQPASAPQPFQYPDASAGEVKAPEGCENVATASDSEGNGLCADCLKTCIEEQTPASHAAESAPLLPSDTLHICIACWAGNHGSCSGGKCGCVHESASVAQLDAEDQHRAAEPVEDAVERIVCHACGMVVSVEYVRALWKALSDYDAARQASEGGNDGGV